MLGAVDTQQEISMQDYQQHTVQTGVERKGLSGTTCWTVVDGPGTVTSQSLSGGLLILEHCIERRLGKECVVPTASHPEHLSVLL